MDFHKFSKHAFHPLVQPQKKWKDIEMKNLLGKYTFVLFYSKKIKRLKLPKKLFLNTFPALLIKVILTGDI